MAAERHRPDQYLGEGPVTRIVLDVVGNVEITLGDGRHGGLVADGQSLVLNVDEPASLAGLAGRRTLRTLAETLSRTGFTLHVRSGDRLLLAAGKDVESDLLSRLLRVPHARFDRRFALRSTLTRGRPKS